MNLFRRYLERRRVLRLLAELERSTSRPALRAVQARPGHPVQR